MKKIFFVFISILIFFYYRVNASTIVMDIDSGRILYENNAYEKKLIASTTKIMTFIVAYENGYLLLDNMVEAGDEILKMYGTSIYISYHEQMSLRDLMYGLMLRSGNDAAVVIANYIAGSEEEFVKLMNNKAKEIGMYNTVFNNCHGLDEETKNYSTAYDMAKLSIYAKQYDFYNEVVNTKYYNVNTKEKAYSWTNRNKFIFLYSKFTGGKNGYTPSAGKTFVSTANNNNLNLTIVTLNDPDIYSHHENLYEEYFNKYKNYVIIKKSTFNKIKKYTDKNIYIKKDLVYPLTENEYKNISYNINLTNNFQANVCGYIELILNNKVLTKENIYLKEEKKVVKKSFLDKIIEIFK